MQQLGYEFCKTDLDMWWKPETRPWDKSKSHSYILKYEDDILCIHHDPDDVLNKLNCHAPLKPGSVGSRNIYLVTRLKFNAVT